MVDGLNFSIRVTGSHWRVLPKRVAWSDFNFLRDQSSWWKQDQESICENKLGDHSSGSVEVYGDLQENGSSEYKEKANTF